MLSRLLRPTVHAFLTWDFRTWFLQWLLDGVVQSFFTTRIAGEDWDVAGGPMGWSWACVCAQSMTAAFARAVLQELGRRPSQVGQLEFCIDNSIVAITAASLSAKQLWAAVKTVANRTGIVVKPSSVEMGDAVDWLCFRLDRRSGTATFKAGFVERLDAARRRIRNGYRQQQPTVMEVWSILGLLIVAVYAAGWPFRLLRAVFAWMKIHAPPPDQPAAWSLRVPFPHPQFVRDVLEALSTATIIPRLLKGGPTLAWAVADASGAKDGLNATVVFTRDMTRLRVYECASPGEHIAHRELCAQVWTARIIADMLPDAPPRVRMGTDTPVLPPTVHLFCDNAVALAAVDRGSSVTAPEPLSMALEDALDVLEQRKGVSVDAHRVPTHQCIADPWTRGAKPVSYDWPRTCAHPFEVGNVCPCILRDMENTGVNVDRVRAFVADPPPWRQTRDPLVDWHTRGIVQ